MYSVYLIGVDAEVVENGDVQVRKSGGNVTPNVEERQSVAPGHCVPEAGGEEEPVHTRRTPRKASAARGRTHNM